MKLLTMVISLGIVAISALLWINNINEDLYSEQKDYLINHKLNIPEHFLDNEALLDDLWSSADEDEMESVLNSYIERDWKK